MPDEPIDCLGHRGPAGLNAIIIFEATSPLIQDTPGKHEGYPEVDLLGSQVCSSCYQGGFEAAAAEALDPEDGTARC